MLEAAETSRSTRPSRRARTTGPRRWTAAAVVALQVLMAAVVLLAAPTPAAAAPQVVDGAICDFNPIDPTAWQLGNGSPAPGQFSGTSWYAIPSGADRTDTAFFVDSPTGASNDVLRQDLTGVTPESQILFDYSWSEGNPAPGDAITLTMSYAGVNYGSMTTPFPVGSNATYTGLNGATLTTALPTIPTGTTASFVLTLPASIPLDGDFRLTMTQSTNNVAAGDDVIVNAMRMDSAGVCLSKETTPGTSGTYTFTNQGFTSPTASIAVGSGAVATFDADSTESGIQPLVPTAVGAQVAIDEVVPTGQEVDDIVCVDQRTGSIVAVTKDADGLVVPASIMAARVHLQCEFRNTQPSVELIKSVSAVTDTSGDGLISRGDRVDFSYVVRNASTVGITGVTVTDLLPGVTVTGGPISLAAGATDSTSFTGSYTITATDVTAGGVENSARVDGTSAGGNPVSDISDAGTTPQRAPIADPGTTETGSPRGVFPNDPGVPGDDPTTVALVAPAPALSLVKSSDPDGTAGEGIDDVGDVITYAFLVTNTGNIAVDDLTIDDAQTAPAGALDGPVVCPATRLLPGASTTCTATYTTTQADMNNGQVDNTATANGSDPDGGLVVSNDSSTTVPMLSSPSIEVVKTASDDEFTEAGEQIIYTFEVANTGDVDLRELALQDPFPYDAPISCAPIAIGETLVVGDDTTCSATYTVTQADLDGAADLPNTVVASGLPPETPSNPTPTRVTDDSTATIAPVFAPALSLVKSAATDDADDIRVGQEITYNFVVTNTGNVTLRDVAIEEGTFTGSGDLPTPTCPAEAAVVAPAAQVVCTTVYTVTQADVDSGEITNDAIASAVPPGTTDRVTSPPSEVAVPSDPDPALTMVKTADTERANRIGQVVTYSFVITNTGDTTLRDATIVEGDFSGHGQLSAPVCPEAASLLLPGEIVTCTATYTIVAADLTGQALTNTATATGTPPGGGTVESERSTVRIPSSGSLPATGGSVPWSVVATGAGLLLAGVVMLLIRRRMPERRLVRS